MSAIERLLANYSRQVNLPWSAHMAGKQRVWFAVYPPVEERRVRAHLPQFEAFTLQANHGWSTVDLTRLLPEWISTHAYREAIFAEPEQFSANTELEDLAVDLVRKACECEEADSGSVIVIMGLASLFDFIRVSSLIERVEDSIRGRLLVFFPGEYAGIICVPSDDFFHIRLKESLDMISGTWKKMVDIYSTIIDGVGMPAIEEHRHHLQTVVAGDGECSFKIRRKALFVALVRIPGKP